MRFQLRSHRLPGFFYFEVTLSESCDKILQFGSGRFLRSFVDLFVHESNQGVGPEQNIVVVQSTGSERARQLSRGPFSVSIRGLSDGQPVDSVTTVESVSRALSAAEEWQEVTEVAQAATLRTIVSNTTEAGLVLDPADTVRSGVPRSYPAKLLDVLLSRYEAGESGLVILPCELVEQNADVLRGLVVNQAETWGIGADATSWVRFENRWCNTLVDRIVSAPPDDHPLLAKDPLLSVTEPFALWAVETRDELPIQHPAIERVDDVSRYALRKVRILNGAHTALVDRALDTFETVREAMADPETRTWLAELVHDEIVPTIADRVDDAAVFADQVFERFDNPFLDHRLADIALHHKGKIEVRLRPTYTEYCKKFGKPPKLLGKVVEGYT